MITCKPRFSCAATAYSRASQHHRVDLSVQVLWTNVVAPIELKPDITASHDYSIALGQVYQRVLAMFELQPRRTQIYSAVADALAIEVLHFTRSATGMPSFTRTGLHGLDLSQQSPGLSMLARLCYATPTQLGHTVQLRFAKCVAHDLCMHEGAASEELCWLQLPSTCLL